MAAIAFDHREAEDLLRRKRATLIQPGTRLERQFINWCRSTEFSVGEILSLFPKVKDGAKGPRYLCDVKCPLCQAWREEDLGISGVRSLISVARRREPVSFDLEFWCVDCTEAQRLERENERGKHSAEEYLARLRAQEQEKARDRAKQIVATCLSARCQWAPELPKDKWFSTMTRESFDEEMVADVICKMTSPQFRQTPYWKAIEHEALSRARGRCTVCAGKGILRVYYRTNDFHGREHTAAGMRELLCLCKHCEITSALQTTRENN